MIPSPETARSDVERTPTPPVESEGAGKGVVVGLGVGGGTLGGACLLTFISFAYVKFVRPALALRPNWKGRIRRQRLISDSSSSAANSE